MASGELVHLLIWDNELVGASGTLTSVPLSSLGLDAEQLELKVSSAAGAADAKLEYAVASDTVGGFGSLTAQEPLIASTAALDAPEEFHQVLLPSVPVFRLTLTELTASLADTRVTARAWFRTRA